MDSRYSDFAEKNPTFQDRIEAFTSGILTPDTKAVALWAMGPGEYYTQYELYSTARRFAGGDFPIRRNAVWTYCNGTPGRCEGSLYRIGAVVKDEIEIMQTPEGPLITVRYAKTEAGADFGDAIAARALDVSGRLHCRYGSMLRIFGAANKPNTAQTRRSYAVYKVTELLARDLGKEFRESDIGEKTRLNNKTLSGVLISLGRAGVISYESPSRERGGRWTKGWAKYSRTDKPLPDSEELYADMREARPTFRYKAALEAIARYIRDHPQEVYSRDSLSRSPKGIVRSSISQVLTFLKSEGYLDSDFEGGRIASIAKANEDTCLLWKGLLEPVGAVAERLDPEDFRGFYGPLEFYNTKPDARTADIRRMLGRYDAERNSRGPAGSAEIDEALLALQPGVMKLSNVVELVNAGRLATLSAQAVSNHLARLVKSGKFENVRPGFYRRIG